MTLEPAEIVLARRSRRHTPRSSRQIAREAYEEPETVLRAPAPEHGPSDGRHPARRSRAVGADLAGLPPQVRETIGRKALGFRLAAFGRAIVGSDELGVGAYESTYRRSLEDPEVFWREAAAAIDWHREPRADPRRLAAAVLPLVPRRRPEHVRQRRRPPRRRRPCRPGGARLRLARSRRRCELTYARAARRGGRSGGRARAGSASARATRSSSTCRWCRRRSSPCSRVPGSARSTRSSSAASPRTSSRCASTTPGRRSCCRRRAASRSSRIVEYKPLLDRPSRRPRTTGRTASSFSATQATAELQPGRDLDWGERDRAAPSRLLASPSSPPIRSTSSTRPARREAEGRRPRQRRPRGRPALEHGEHLRHASRRGVLGGVGRRLGRSATPTSSTPRCWPGAPRSSTRASRSARPTPARSGG